VLGRVGGEVSEAAVKRRWACKLGAGKMRSVVDVGRSRDAAYKWAMEALGAAFVVKDFLKEVFVHLGPLTSGVQSRKKWL
jgi:hypothetical protein